MQKEVTKFFIFLSELLDKVVLDEKGRVVGQVHDMAMCINGEVYPKSEALIIRRGFLKKQYAQVSMQNVNTVEDKITLNINLEKVVFQNSRIACEFSLCRDILDQQVVDINNQKVVRVNDVHLLRVNNYFYLAHVDIGSRALIRRLGWTKVVDGFVKIFFKNSGYLTEEDFISWKNTQVLNIGRSKNVLRLDVAREKLSQIPSAQLADIMEDLAIFERVSLFKCLDVEVQRKVFTDLPIKAKGEFISQIDDREAVNLLENIPADEATDLLMALPKRKTLKLMRLMQTKTSKKLLKLLGFAKDSAGGLMTTEYLCLPQNAYVKDAIQKIKDNTDYPGNIFYIYIVDEEHRLVGSTSLRRFINRDSNTPIMETCYPNKVFVRTDDGMEEIAILLEKYKFFAIPVLNDKDILQGVITSDDILEELISLTWKKYKEKL